MVPVTTKGKYGRHSKELAMESISLTHIAGDPMRLSRSALPGAPVVADERRSAAKPARATASALRALAARLDGRETVLVARSAHTR